MSITLESLGIDRLSVPKRLELMQQIWDSMPESVEPQEVPEWHLRELERRIASADGNPEAAEPWEAVLARLSRKHRY
jgi:putative addiction module component (TIGR02574 family)